MKRITLLLFAVLAGLSTCQQVPQDEAIEFVNVDGKEIPVIWPEKIAKEKSLRSSDIFDDVELIKLENNELSMIKYVFRKFVGEDYIIVSSNECGIIHFDRNGNFVKVLAKLGKGPGEVNDPNRNMFVDDKMDKVYVVDKNIDRKKLLEIDIQTGDHRYIDFANTGNEFSIRDAIVLDDGNIYCTTMPMMGSKSDNPLFCQTQDGELLWELKMMREDGMNNAQLRLTLDQLYFNYLFSVDTIYRVINEGIEPVFILQSEAPPHYPDPQKGSVGMGVIIATNELVQGYYLKVEDVKYNEVYRRNRPVYSERKRFIYHTKKNEIYWVTNYYNEYLGVEEDFYLRTEQNGINVRVYDALELYEIVDSLSQVPDLEPELQKRINHLAETVDPEDNPYLLVGKLKK